MESLFITRGHIDDTEKFIRNLRSLWLPFKYQGHEFVEMNVKPILLWNIAYPKEYHDTVINTLMNGNYEGNQKMLNEKYKGIKKFIWGLRKVLGLKPITKPKTNKRFIVWSGNVEVFPIGIKDDDYTLKDTDGRKVEGI